MEKEINFKELYDYSLGNRKLIWNEEKQAMIMTDFEENDRLE